MSKEDESVFWMLYLASLPRFFSSFLQVTVGGGRPLKGIKICTSSPALAIIDDLRATSRSISGSSVDVKGTYTVHVKRKKNESFTASILIKKKKHRHSYLYIPSISLACAGSVIFIGSPCPAQLTAETWK